ncbi:hypothetical protein R1sor_023597 [Riccia sorocarpa]|uniref:Reverse transcriptase domain-containing protein n=1 Tax=Riccia sorocarpa TaxID=122646 RepID=A0ABD3GPX6_9MARC
MDVWAIKYPEAIHGRNNTRAGQRSTGVDGRWHGHTKLDEIPSEELINEVVGSLPKDKSAGFDGVITEFLRAEWEFMHHDCYKMCLWDTLKALGMDEINNIRIQRLVMGGKAQAHINGAVTGRFEVQRGLRQGCPLAPFAITTHPLMRLLKEKEAAERIMGVAYGWEKTLLRQIYADDTGINLTMCKEQFTQLR